MSTAPAKLQLVDQYGQPLKADPKKPAAQPFARYDAAQTDATNRKHWLAADSLGPVNANSASVRQLLRDRSRYETANNGYASGLIEGRANDTIGTGPRLQLSLPESWTDPDFRTRMASSPTAARDVELLFLNWAEAVGLPDKLWLMDRTESEAGEVFGVEVTNEELSPDGTAPTLDLRLYEPDQCSTPGWNASDPYSVDGIVFAKNGKPIEYHFLRFHPGDSLGVNVWGDYDRIPADRVYHLFSQKRPGQARGIPAMTAALPLYAIMRRFTLAALSSAEIAAMIAGVIETDLPADGLGAPTVESMDEIEFARNALLTLSAGQKAKAFTAAQPGPSYREFKSEIHTECGRSVGAPRNVSTGSSAEYNYSSGRLDHLPYQRGIKIRRDRYRRLVLDRLFRSWVREAALIPNFLPPDLPPVALWRWRWQWDGFQSIDPVKDTTANQIALESGQTTLERICAENGDDWEEVLEQQARELAKRRALGLPDPAAKPVPATQPAPQGAPANA